MSRVTPPISKITRSISQTARRAQSGYSIGNFARVGLGMNFDVLEANHDGRNKDLTDPASYIGFSQPIPNPRRTIPLMQTFHTSSKAQAELNFKPIDMARLPDIDSLQSPSSIDSHAFRFPLLPDSFHRKYASETIESLPDLRSAVVAAKPENVHAFTEIEGLNFDGVELNFIHDHSPSEELLDIGGQSMVRAMWDELEDFENSGKSLAF